MSLENTKIVQKSGRAWESVIRFSRPRQRLSMAEQGTEDERGARSGTSFHRFKRSIASYWELRNGESFLFVLINLASSNWGRRKSGWSFLWSPVPLKKGSTSGNGKVRNGEAQNKVYCEPWRTNMGQKSELVLRTRTHDFFLSRPLACPRVIPTFFSI